jgi:hypothetical protein
MLTAIRQWVVQTMMKGQTGVVRTLPKPQIIELNTQITAERMMRNGINPNDMKTVGQVENVVKQIDTPKVNVNPGVTGVKKADVLDMEGNKIDTSKGIMGGKQIQPINMTVEERTGGLLKGKYESDEAIKARLVADNEKGIASMKKKLDDPEEKADGGRIGLLAGSVPKVLKLLKNKKRVQQAVDDIFPTGDYKYDAQMAADALVENNPKTFGGKLYEDLDMDTQMEVYGAVLQPITNKMATQMKLQRATKPEKTLASMEEGKGIDMSDPEIADEFGRFMKETDPEGYKKLEQTVELSNFKTKGRKENSDGGRIGLKAGMTKRGFLKLMGSVGAGIGAAKSGIFSGFGKGAGKTVAKEVAQQTTSSTPPPYFFKLAEKIKKLGDDAVATQDKAIAKKYKDYTLEEDFAGNITIMKKGDDVAGNKIEDVYMSLKVDEVPLKGKKGSAKVQEYEEFTARPDGEGKMKDVEPGVPDDILEEIAEQAPSIKYASGGLAYMLGE